MTLPELTYTIASDQRIAIVDVNVKYYSYFSGTAEEFNEFNSVCCFAYDNYKVSNVYTIDNILMIEVLNRDEI